MRLTRFVIATGDISSDPSSSSSVVTGSISSQHNTKGTPVGKITLRQGEGNPPSLASFNTIIKNGEITQSGGSFHVTGTLSAASDSSYSESQRAAGDVLIIGESF